MKHHILDVRYYPSGGWEVRRCERFVYKTVRGWVCAEVVFDRFEKRHIIWRKYYYGFDAKNRALNAAMV